MLTNLAVMITILAGMLTILAVMLTTNQIVNIPASLPSFLMNVAPTLTIHVRVPNPNLTLYKRN